jgi:hypothetical protein
MPQQVWICMRLSEAGEPVKINALYRDDTRASVTVMAVFKVLCLAITCNVICPSVAFTLTLTIRKSAENSGLLL